MNQSKIAVRYAKALFELGNEKGIIEALHRDMELVLDLCNSSPGFIHTLENPVNKTSYKKQVISQLFEKYVDSLSLRFLLLIIDHRRESCIPGICRNFLDMARSVEGITTAIITTAAPLTPAMADDIRRYLELKTGKTIELTEKVKPGIIGGVILRIDDHQYDASIATNLKKIRTVLLDNDLHVTI